MAVINKEQCIGCRICQKYCTVEAIYYDSESRKCYIDQDECVECYVCLRQQVCPQRAIKATNFKDNFYKQFQHVLSDPVENHGVTGVTGRGTEEVKTNDVTGRVKKGEIGIAVDMGRPGMGVYLRDAEKVAVACVNAGVKLEPVENSPLAALMPDINTGKLEPEALDYRLLSVIIEGNCKEKDLKKVLEALKKVSQEIDTVFSLGLIARVNEEGETKALNCLEELDIPFPHRGKVNIGLGRPLSLK